MYLIYASLILLALVVIDLLARIYYGRKALRLLENLPTFNIEKALPQKQAIPFEFQTTDRITLRGSIYHPDEMPPLGVILFCPETNSNHWSATKYTQGLIDNGYIVVSFDFRNQGESDSLDGYQPMHWVTEYELDDLEAAVRWVAEQAAFKDLPVGLLGISRGGATALAAMKQLDSIDFIALDSSFTNDLLITHYMERWARVIVPGFLFKFYPISQMRKTLDLAIWYSQYKRNCRYVNSSNFFEGVHGKRVLLIAGARDSYVPLRITRQLKKMLGELCADLWVAPQASHNGARELYPQEYDGRLIAFFQQMVAGRVAAPFAKELSLPGESSVEQHGEKVLATHSNEN